MQMVFIKHIAFDWRETRQQKLHWNCCQPQNQSKNQVFVRLLASFTVKMKMIECLDTCIVIHLSRMQIIKKKEKKHCPSMSCCITSMLLECQETKKCAIKQNAFWSCKWIVCEQGQQFLSIQNGKAMRTKANRHTQLFLGHVISKNQNLSCTWKSWCFKRMHWQRGKNKTACNDSVILFLFNQTQCVW